MGPITEYQTAQLVLNAHLAIWQNKTFIMQAMAVKVYIYREQATRAWSGLVGKIVKHTIL